jgi:hypothetical protein
MNRDGKITEGTGWVNPGTDPYSLVAVLERWVFIHGSAPLNIEVEYEARK